MSSETGHPALLLSLTVALLLTTSREPGRASQDTSTDTTLASTWEAVSHGILRDRRTDLGVILDFATCVLRDATALPRTLELNEASLLGIEFVDEELGMTGRTRTFDVTAFTPASEASVYLVTRIERDQFLQQPVRFEIHVKWFGVDSVVLEVAVFSILSGREEMTLIQERATKFGGYEFTAHLDLADSAKATVYGKDLWHPRQTAKKRWEEQPPAAPLVQKARALMQTSRDRFVRIQGGLKVD